MNPLLRRWTEEDDAELRRLYGEAMNDGAIAVVLDRSLNAIAVRRQRLSLTSPLPTDVADPMERWGRGGYAHGGRFWTEARVLEALRAYAATHRGPLPATSDEYQPLKVGDPSLPTMDRLFELYGSIAGAWKSALPRVTWQNRLRVVSRPWTEQEIDYLLSSAGGDQTLTQIAHYLHRSAAACRRKLFDHGTTARANLGFMSAAEVAREYGCGVERVQRFCAIGALPAKLMHGNRYAIDPTDAAEIADALRAPPTRGKGWRADANGKPIPPKGRRSDVAVVTRYRSTAERLDERKRRAS